MVILNCPSCGTPLIYYYGKTSVVTENELNRLQKSGFLKNATHLLREISECGIKLHEPKTIKPYTTTAKRLNITKRKPYSSLTCHSLGMPIRADYFTKDDLMDLKIELETCQSVDNFLSRI
jgi:hypothetical protein